MPLPKGDVHKKKEIIQDVTLHDLDVANARPQVRLQLSVLVNFNVDALWHNSTARVLDGLVGRPRHHVDDGSVDETQED